MTKKYNPANRKANAKWYATPVNAGKISAFQLNRQIVISSKQNKKEVKRTIDATVEEITKLLTDDYSVCLGTLGTFRVSFSSEGVEKSEEFQPEMINNIKVIFKPAVELLEKLKEKVKTKDFSSQPIKIK